MSRYDTSGIKVVAGGLVVKKPVSQDLQELLAITRQRERQRAIEVHALLAEFHCTSLFGYVVEGGVKGLYAGMNYVGITFSAMPKMLEVESRLEALEKRYK